MALQQVIEGRYVDRARLLHLLKKTFGENNFAVRVGGYRGARRKPANDSQLQLNRWILSVPKRLTEVGISDPV